MIPNITTGADFEGLIDYLVENRDHEVLDARGVSSVALAAQEMEAVAALSHRAKVKLIHLSLSAAHEDGKLLGSRWLEAVDRHEQAFGLAGHQRVVVRHKDKTHDHVHVFWCTISIETGQTPPKRWFLRKGFAQENIGPQALSEEQAARVPVQHRARRTYDFILLRRAQHLCRQLERDFGLRQLRSPEQSAAARLAGEERAPSSGQKKRAERTGASPIIDRAPEIRLALNERDWAAKRRALLKMNLDLEPVFRVTKNGPELRGLVIFDRSDPGNRMKASQLDTAHVKYGWRKLQERHEHDAPTLEQWWPHREVLPFAPPTLENERTSRLKGQFELLTEQHRIAEAEKRARLSALRRKQKLEIAAKRLALTKQRAAEAAKLAPGERRRFYSQFAKTVRAPELVKLTVLHREQAIQHVRSRKATWTEFLQFAAAAGDVDAQRLLVRTSRGKTSTIEREREREAGTMPQLIRAATPAPTQPDRSEPIIGLSPEELLRAMHDYRATSMGA